MRDRAPSVGAARMAFPLVCAATFVAVSAWGEPPQGPGRWVQKAPLPVSRTEISVAELDGKVYVFGGYVHGSVTSNLNQVYDPAPDTWRDLRIMPMGLNHVGVIGHQGKIYHFGGFIRQNRDPVANAFAYDPRADKWEEIAPLPSKRGAAAIVALDGKLHVIGGAIGGDHGVGFEGRLSVTLHEVYDPATNAWSPRAPLPERRDHLGLVVVEGKIHAIAGRRENFFTNTARHDVYDPKTDTWSLRAPLPTPRSGFVAALLDGYIVVIGGEGDRGVYDENEAYHPKTDRWYTLARMLTPRHGTGAAVVGGMLYLPGGAVVRGGEGRSAAHEAFTLR